VTPRALIHRLERGVVYAPEKAQRAIENFFTESNLTALRELAMRQTAHQLEDRRDEIRSPQPVLNRRPTSEERVLLWLTPHPSAAMLIRRGRRVSDYLGAPCSAVYSEKDATALEPWLNFCHNLRIDTRAIDDPQQARGVAEYARQQAITQVYVTRHAPDVNQLVNLARDMQVTIVAERVRREH
jgi:two-component system sensor histidine kinase KdpD